MAQQDPTRIPFNRPPVLGPEIEAITEVLSSRSISGDGPFTCRCQRLIERQTGAVAALLTHSCTAALEMAAILADLGPGDEVVMPSYTFVSTANAVVLRGAVPVFVDIRRDTLNIDETRIEQAITPRTRAIMVVHYAGVPCDMAPIEEIAAAHNLLVIEDAAQAMGSTYCGRPAGALGHLSAFSFHETKNIVSGEGGALAIGDARFRDRAEVIWQKGTNRKQFMRGQVDKYSWVDVGSSFLPAEIIAAYLQVQLENLDFIVADRCASWQRYRQAFDDLTEWGFGLPVIPADCSHNGHLFYLLAPTHDMRDELIARLQADSISAPFHYVPLHSAPAGRRFGRVAGDMTMTDDLSARLLRIPLYYGMGRDIDVVIERVRHHAQAMVHETAR